MMIASQIFHTGQVFVGSVIVNLLLYNLEK